MKNKIINYLIQIPFLWRKKEIFNDGMPLIVYTYKWVKGIEYCMLKEYDKGLNWVINEFLNWDKKYKCK